jgi:RNA recognition motif-containing protein
MKENYLLVCLFRKRRRKKSIFDIILGGLTWDTTQEDLREYFSSFGNVLDCSIKHDPSTGRSRGFAFLVFDSKDMVDKILSQNDHFVKGRRVDPKPAHRRSNATNNQMNNHISSQSSLYGAGPTSTMSYTNMAMGMGANANPLNNNRKVFIGGLDPSFPDSQLREYFSKFGKIDGKKYLENIEK